MKTVQALLVITSLSFATASCWKGRCDGADEIQYNYAMGIENISGIGSTVVYSINNVFFDELRLSTISRSEEGDRNCHLKNLVTEIGELIDTNTITVYCNRDIKSKNVTVPAGDNLRQSLRDELSRHIRLEMRVDDVVQDVPYIYYVKGKTDRGNSFTDSVEVVYRK